MPISILHLEDSVQDHDLVAHCLESASVDAAMVRVGSRSEFLQFLSYGKWDVILADYHLPDYDGISALHQVRQADSDLPFIFVSGVLGEEIAIETLKSGATDYVLKTRLGRLPAAVKRALKELDDRLRTRAAERALQETEHRFEAMADASPMPVWVLGPTGGHQFANRAWLDFIGKPSEKKFTSHWIDCVHPDDRMRYTEVFSDHLLRQKPFTLELRLLRSDNQYRWSIVNVSPRFSTSSEFLGMIGSWIDVTDLKQTEERLRHVAKLESLGVLAAGIAHDFNNLLTRIIGHAELLKNKFAENDSRVSLVENILQAGDSAAELTRQILAYSGRGEFVIEPVNLSGLVRDNETLIGAAIPKNVKIEFDLQDDLPAVDCDPGQIQQVVMNLIINACEASQNEIGRVWLRTYLQEIGSDVSEPNLIGDRLSRGRYVVFEVSDDGVGMDAATQSRIFDPFFTTKFAGRGLGLAAVMGILRGHKAGLRLRSEIGNGSTFAVFFPESNRKASTEAPPKTESCSEQLGRILIVDDEPSVLNSLRLALQRNGFHVGTAVNREDALGKLKDAFDLIVFDTSTPEMSGAEELSRIRVMYPEMRVIGISGSAEEEAIPNLRTQLDGFLQKPFTGSRLVGMISAVLDSRERDVVC